MHYALIRFCNFLEVHIGDLSGQNAKGVIVSRDCVILQYSIAVPLESYDRVPCAHARVHVWVHVWVCVNNIVWSLRFGLSMLSPVICPVVWRYASPFECLRERACRTNVAAGKLPAPILRELAKEDIVTTRQTVQHRIFCWMKGARLADHSRSGRPLLIMKSIAHYTDRMLEEDEVLSTTELHWLITRKVQ